MSKARWEQLLSDFIHAADPDDAREKKRRRILASATRLFAHHGYRKTSVSDVARDAGVAKGTVYLYFETKSALFLQCAALEKQQFSDRIGAIFAPSHTSEQRLRAYLITVFELIEEMPLARKLTSGGPDLHEVFEDMAPLVREQSDAARMEFMRGLLLPFAEHRGWSAADVDARVHALLALVLGAHAINEQRRALGLDAPAFAETLVDVLVTGLT
jgi:AcrR family transcriptional regulator